VFGLKPISVHLIDDRYDFVLLDTEVLICHSGEIEEDFPALAFPFDRPSFQIVVVGAARWHRQ
jgi:hypothetical protein